MRFQGFLRALILPLACLFATLFCVAMAYAQVTPTLVTTSPPAPADTITTREVMAFAVACVGSLLTLTVAIYSGYQTKQIHRAQATADEAKKKADEVERDLFKNYDTNTRTTRILEQAMKPVQDELHKVAASVDAMRDQFVNALVSIHKGT